MNLEGLEKQVQLQEDILAIENLQKMYSYYFQVQNLKGIIELFSDEAESIEITDHGYFKGKEGVKRLFWDWIGGSGRPRPPMPGGIVRIFQLQGVITVEDDGKNANGRWSCLDLARVSGATWPENSLPTSWSRGWIQTHWQQLLSHENVATLLKQPCQNFPEEIRHSYLLATRLLDDGGQMVVSSFIGDWLSDCDWQEREAELAGGLQQMYGRLRKGRLAYVGGWEHLLHTSSTGTLYDRLKHLQPRRVLLDNGRYEM